jgi:hypothetical protein
MSALEIGLISAGGAVAFSAITFATAAWAQRRRRSRYGDHAGRQAQSASIDDRADGASPSDIGPRAPVGGGDQVSPVIAGPPDEPFPFSSPPSATPPAAADTASTAESPDQWQPPWDEAPSRSVPPPAAEEPPTLSLPLASPGDELPAGGGARPPGPARFARPVPPPPPTPPAAPDRPGARFANASLSDAANGQVWARDQAVWPEALLQLRLDIGPLSETSQVSEPVPFPDDRLPPGDLQIDVVVSSSSFRVGRDLGEVPTDSSAEDSFLLPGDGSPARAPDGGSTLTFVLRAPAEAGLAMARVTYYFRGAVVQSHLLSAQIGAEATTDQGDLWSIVTDYTVAAVLATASAIPDRPRVAVILNGNGTEHQIYLRTRGADSEKPESAAANLPPAIGDATREFRETLASPSVAPTTSRQSRAQLVTALRALARLGWDMYSALFSVVPDVLLGLGDGSTSVVLHVARPAGVTLSVPWALVYTIPLHEPIEQVPLCPLIAKWDGHSALVTGQPMSCPQSGAVPHASDLLCPFGFLGYRFDIEQLSSTKDPVLSISAPPGSRVVLAETTYQVNKKALEEHITDIAEAVTRLSGVGTDEAKNKDQLKQLISRDLPLVYFFCHGDRPDLDRPETYLGIGNNEHVRPQDLVGWIQEAFFTQQLRLWNQIRPLVFINACHSAEIDPKALFSYIDVFVGGGNAAGVIGTEVKVSQPLAMEFAKMFFDQLLAPGATVATALRHARLEFLAKGNLFGLNYTPYCWADLTIAS